MRSAVALALGLCAASALPGSALANGRFPRAERLLEDPRDPNHLYLAATFGLLETADRGKNWYQICESAFALKTLEGDPQLEVLPDGSLLTGIFETLNRSEDCGCGFHTVLAEPEAESVLDVSLHRSGKVVALVRDISSFPGRVHIAESSDNARTFYKLSDLPSEVVDAYTIDVAPSDPARLYLTVPALNGAPAALLVSNDRGESWERRVIPGTDTTVLPYIAAVDAKNADRVFVRTDNWDDELEFHAQDALLVSDDAGKTWRQVLHRQAKLLGFALSPDGSTVLAGYGDPIEAGRSVNPDDFGVYRASSSELSFERISIDPVACLRWTGTGLYACILQTPPDLQVALGFAADANFSLATPSPFTTLLDQRDVRGPLGCTAAQCTEAWETGVEGGVAVCNQLAASCSFEAAKNVLSCVPPSSDGGLGGAGGEAGAGGAGASSTGGVAGKGGTTNAAGAAGASDAGASSGGNGTGGANQGGTLGGASGGAPTASGGRANGGHSGTSGGAGGPPITPQGGALTSGGGAGSTGANPDGGGCGCSVVGRPTATHFALALALLSLGAARRKQRRAR
jgi:MYXO-CTERM domain-containing protein